MHRLQCFLDNEKIMRKKTIVIIAGYTKSLISFRLHLMQQFIAHGYKVVACAPDDDALVVSKLHSQNIAFEQIELKRSAVSLWSDLLVLCDLCKIFKKYHPEIVFSYTIKPVIYGSIAAKISGIDSIYSMITGLGYVFIDDSKKVKILRYIVSKLYKTALRFNQKVFFQNPDDLKLFSDNRFIDGSKAVLINGCGVDTSYYVPTSFPVKCTFLFIGRFIVDKGIKEYISAAEEIKKIYPNVILELVGYCDDNPNSITESELKEIAVSGVVDFLGALDDVRSALANSSVFVLPSYREGTPRAVLEAMSCGRAIITTDAPGCRETVIDGVNGYLVPVKNVERLVEAMEKFILHPELIHKMGKESRRIAENKYDVNKVNQVILKTMGI